MLRSCPLTASSLKPGRTPACRAQPCGETLKTTMAEPAKQGSLNECSFSVCWLCLCASLPPRPAPPASRRSWQASPASPYPDLNTRFPWEVQAHAPRAAIKLSSGLTWAQPGMPGMWVQVASASRGGDGRGETEACPAPLLALPIWGRCPRWVSAAATSREALLGHLAVATVAGAGTRPGRQASAVALRAALANLLLWLWGSAQSDQQLYSPPPEPEPDAGGKRPSGISSCAICATSSWRISTSTFTRSAGKR